MGNSDGKTPRDWLMGTWQSDREKTIAAWGNHPPGSPPFQAILLRELGELVIRYTAKRRNSGVAGENNWTSYRVLWASNDSLFLVYGPKRKESGQSIHFVSPIEYWVHAGRYIEYFTKVDVA
jgi:hypothetical protein